MKPNKRMVTAAYRAEPEWQRVFALLQKYEEHCEGLAEPELVDMIGAIIRMYRRKRDAVKKLTSQLPELKKAKELYKQIHLAATAVAALKLPVQFRISTAEAWQEVITNAAQRRDEIARHLGQQKIKTRGREAASDAKSILMIRDVLADNPYPSFGRSLTKSYAREIAKHFSQDRLVELEQRDLKTLNEKEKRELNTLKTILACKVWTLKNDRLANKYVVDLCADLLYPDLKGEERKSKKNDIKHVLRNARIAREMS